MKVFRSRAAVLPTGERAADVVVEAGRITAVEPYGRVTGGELTDLGTDVLLPGLVDTHVHVNEPGRTSWEGFATATRAAAAGGVTTLIDMPLNSVPPTTTVENLEVKRAAAAGQAHVDVGFWGGAVGQHSAELAKLHAAGVFGFKAFLAPSGVPEFPHLAGDELEATLTELARLGACCLVHAEAPELLDAAPPAAGRSYRAFLRSRPPAAEEAAVVRLVEAARRTGATVHVLHVSAAEVLPLVDAARADGVPITAETCPHYLSLAAEEIADGDTASKCCPPIREAANREALWRGLVAGSIDLVASDHSPSPPELKQVATGDFGTAWGGISGLQVGLPAVWTEARSRGHGLLDVVRWMSSGPAAFAGLPTKGTIAVGRDADLVAFAADAEFVVDPAALHHRHPVTPYAGRSMRGVVRGTWLRGEPVDGSAARGRLLERMG
ncbi:MAG TPA: allantoinase AllB [Jiangellaceae bacterium]|nr:allantoinase AllB [Jiangellaceae bacterium]